MTGEHLPSVRDEPDPDDDIVDAELVDDDRAEGAEGGPENPAVDERPGETGPGSPVRSRLTLALGAAAVVFGLLALLLSFALAADDDGARPDAEVASTASRFAAALLEYDAADLEGFRARVVALATGSFRGEFEDTYEQVLVPFISDAGATSAATIKDVFLGNVTAESAEAVVVFDQVLSDGTGVRRAFDQYLRLSLVRTTEGWRVDGVTNLNLNLTNTVEGRDLDGVLGGDAPDAPPTGSAPADGATP